jgi:hypothetical protein
MPIQIKTKSPSKIKVNTRIAVPDTLSIDNIDVSGIGDGYVLMYNHSLGRYTFVDPDEVLSKSVEDNFLPSDFIQKLDTDLDNKIDVDAGSF